MLVLSIDWDFFIPGAIKLWRDGIDEDYYNLIAGWKKVRIGKNIKVENATDFWKWLRKWFIIPESSTILVSESHVAMSGLLKPSHKLILFDSHHDCYYNTGLDCGSWGTHWLEQNSRAQTIWVSQFTEKVIKDFEWTIKGSVLKKIKSVSFEKVAPVFNAMYLEKKRKLRFDFVHVCRSGCWSPPLFDTEFVKFLESSKCNIKRIHDFMKVDPLGNRMLQIVKEQSL